MKLNVRCRSGLRIDFEGSIDELERFDGFLAELARLERDRLAPAPGGELARRIAEPFPEPSPPSDPAPAAAPVQVADTTTDATPPARTAAPRAGGQRGRTPRRDSPQITLAGYFDVPGRDDQAQAA